MLPDDAGGSAEVAPCGKPQNTNAGGVDAKFSCTVADQSHRPLGILQGCGVFLQSRPTGHPVFQKDSGDSDGIQPFTDLGALQVEREDGIAAARADHHGSAGLLVGRRFENRQSWFGNIGQPDERFSRNQPFVRFAHILLLSDVAFFSRGSVRPQFEGLRCLTSMERDCELQSEAEACEGAGDHGGAHEDNDACKLRQLTGSAIAIPVTFLNPASRIRKIFSRQPPGWRYAVPRKPIPEKIHELNSSKSISP